MADPAEKELLEEAEAEVDKENGALTWDFGRCKDMKTAPMKRLTRDLLRIENDPPPGVSAAPQDDDIMSWKAVVCDPNFAPWEGATFVYGEVCPYPACGRFHLDNVPPKQQVESTLQPFLAPQRILKCLLPYSVYEDGHMDLDIIRDLWNPVFDFTEMLLSVQCLLSNPDLNDPANDEAAKMLIEYISRVRETVEKSWIAD